eukprot:SAG31_NODE_353_length_17229_cov_8.702160_17_plen_135_part_00
MGGNEWGQLGLGHKKTIPTPKRVPGTYVRVAVGMDFSCAITDKGHVACCGKPEYGQCGNGTTGEYFVTASKLDFDCVLQPTQVHGTTSTPAASSVNCRVSNNQQRDASQPFAAPQECMVSPFETYGAGTITRSL